MNENIIPIEEELLKLNKSITHMLALAKAQLEKAKDAFVNFDEEIAQEIAHKEKRLNAYELSIDRDCEYVLALYNPVATDLRYVISMLKINSSIERLGDLAKGIAKFVTKMDKPINKKLLKVTQFEEMMDIAISMADDILEAIIEEDTHKARKVFKKDLKLDKINVNIGKVIEEELSKNPGKVEHALYLFSSAIKLERYGDYVKNIAEELIFHIEAKVIKHTKIKLK